MAHSWNMINNGMLHRGLKLGRGVRTWERFFPGTHIYPLTSEHCGMLELKKLALVRIKIVVKLKYFEFYHCLQ